MSDNIKKAVRIACGCAILLCLGISLVWSIFMVPVETLLSASRSQTSFVSTVNVLMFSVGSLVTGRLSRRISYAWIVRMAAVLVAAGFFGLSHLSALWQLYVFYGILIGIGVGMGYNSVISVFPRWMPDSPATATGILLMGYAFSATLLGPIVSSIITSSGVLKAFLFLTFFAGAGLFVFSFAVRIPKEGELKTKQKTENVTDNSVNVPTGIMVRQPVFWLFFLFAILAPGIGNALIGHNSPILTEEFMLSTTAAAAFVSITAAVNGLGRFVFGFVIDKLGVRTAILFIGCGICISMILVFSGICTGLSLLYMIGTCVLFLFYGCSATSFPSIIRKLYGNRYFSSNYAILSTQCLVTAFFATVVGIIQTATGSYRLPLALLLVLAGVNFIVVLVFVRVYKNSGKKLEEDLKMQHIND